MISESTARLADSSWRRRPVEEVRLLNPAFLGTLLYCAAKGYQSKDDKVGLPYALAFVALPVVLQKATRDDIPRAISTSLAAWLSVHPSALVGFPDRARAIAPLVRQSIAMSCAGSVISLEQNQIFPRANMRQLNEYKRDAATTEVVDCMKKAHFVGRWLAASGDYTTVMALWGVRP